MEASLLDLLGALYQERLLSLLQGHLLVLILCQGINMLKLIEEITRLVEKKELVVRDPTLLV